MDIPSNECSTNPSQDIAEENAADDYMPAYDSLGRCVTSLEEYSANLSTCRRKEPLFLACKALSIAVPKSASLDRLRQSLISHCFPNSQSQDAEEGRTGRRAGRRSIEEPVLALNGTDEVRLAEEYAVEGAVIDDILGVDSDDDESDEEVEGLVSGAFDQENDDDDDDKEHAEFRRRLRVDETLRAEAHRRAGGIKTQEACVKAWKEFVSWALGRKKIKDNIIDEHHLLLWIKFSAERPKKSKQGVDQPGTFIGASQLKKLYFGTLRIRKQQEAEDPTLQFRRPATSVIVWDALRTRMHEALERERNGLVPAEDAPDIIANTFLDSVTDEQLDRIGMGFLSHTHLHSAINGHLAWTGQMASGNRGDDFRALKLCELQPYTFLHPNGETGIESVLGLQGEEKAGGRGMKTKINPVYTAFITHLQPEKCPIGAFAFYHHYIHDMKNFTESLNIDWSLNKSWRQIRVLHGPNSPTTPYNEQSLYNLYVKAFQKADFTSGIKAHLPRHILGYRQERLGVDRVETAKMGWVRGETYFDTYAPALPKKAILAAHGFKQHESYDPVWRHVHVPEQFLSLVCPMAEGIHQAIVGRDNLTGAANYWQMVMWSRKYVFLCGAAIFEKCPTSPIFRLPALSNRDVRNWMKTDFRTNLSLLRAKAGSPVDLQRIQNESLRLALEEVRSLLATQTILLQSMTIKLERRTAPLSPTKAYSHDLYHHRLQAATDKMSAPPPFFKPPALVPTSSFSQPIKQSDSTALPAAVPDMPLDDVFLDRLDPELHPESPAPQQLVESQIDLVLPFPLAFTDHGVVHAFWPPLLGQKHVSWDQIYPLIKRPEMLWECWKPRTLDSYASVEEQWIAYNSGEMIKDNDGTPTGMKPPLRQVEQFFKSKWRTIRGQSGPRKAWERFSEVPNYIEKESKERGLSPQAIIQELEDLRLPQDGRSRMGLNALMKEVKAIRERKVLEQKTVDNTPREQPPDSDISAPQLASDQHLKRKPAVEIRRHTAPKRSKT